MNIQNKRGVVLGFSLVVLAASAIAALALAAGVTLTNGGLGQVAGNTQSFGVAVCNGGASAVSQSVPVTVSSNGQTATVSSAAPIAAGVCTYSYVNYGALGMAAGQAYSVSVTIDPNKTVISNSNNQATYSVTVPPATVAAANPGATTASTQPTSFLATIGAAFANFFTALKNLF